MAERELVTPEILARIGTESDPLEAADEVTSSELRRWVIATLDDNPLWYDAEFAEGTRFGAGCVPAPFPMRAVGSWKRPMGRPDAVRELDFDDDYRAELDDVKSIKIRWPAGIGSYHGGNEIEYFQFPRIGDRLFLTAKIVDIQAKTGKSGKLALVYMDSVFTNQDGDVLMINHGMTIAREMPSDTWTTQASPTESANVV